MACQVGNDSQGRYLRCIACIVISHSYAITKQLAQPSLMRWASCHYVLGTRVQHSRAAR